MDEPLVYQLSRHGHHIVVDLRGGAIFPHPMEWSIFAATRLSFQVRNGTGRFPCAMPPAKLVVHTLPTHRLGFVTLLFVCECLLLVWQPRN